MRTFAVKQFEPIFYRIGALLLIAACFYMKKRKETSGGTTGPKTKQVIIFKIN